MVDFLLYTMYPVAAIFAVELASRAARAPKWAKLWAQAAASAGFGAYYWFVLPEPRNFPLTALVLLALAAALAYQGRRARVSPDMSPY